MSKLSVLMFQPLKTKQYVKIFSKLGKAIRRHDRMFNTLLRLMVCDLILFILVLCNGFALT